MKAFHDLIGMPLVTLDEGKRLGKLRGLDFDGASGRVQGLYFAGDDGQPDGMVPWSAVRSLGRDAVTISPRQPCRPAPPLPIWVSGRMCGTGRWSRKTGTGWAW